MKVDVSVCDSGIEEYFLDRTRMMRAGDDGNKAPWLHAPVSGVDSDVVGGESDMYVGAQIQHTPESCENVIFLIPHSFQN